MADAGNQADRPRDANVHVVSVGCVEIERWLIFRDRLRASPRDRRLYERTKRALARRRWPDTDACAAAKSDVVERIIAAGRTTAEASDGDESSRTPA